jgi:hypothetical protein
MNAAPSAHRTRIVAEAVVSTYIREIASTPRHRPRPRDDDTASTIALVRQANRARLRAAVPHRARGRSRRRPIHDAPAVVAQV